MRKFKITRGSKIRANKIYRDQYDQAKSDFKERTGKKVARGFTDSPEFKTVQRKESRTLRRYERRDEAIIQARKASKSRENGKPSIDGKLVTRVTGSTPKPFYAELSYSDKDGADKDVVIEWKEAAARGLVVTGTIINEIDKTENSYTDLFNFLSGIKKLYNRLKKIQFELNERVGEDEDEEDEDEDEEIDYPLTTTFVIENEKSANIVVTAHL